MLPTPGSTNEPSWVTVPLDAWEAPSPVTAALHAGSLPQVYPRELPPLPRSPALAEALASWNRRWHNPVDEELNLWLAGAQVVVAGQQPGLWGGPLLSLVKACAVAAEVARLRAEGRPAVGFFWLEMRDDDLPEMGWGRVVVGGELFQVREAWARKDACAFAAKLSSKPSAALANLPKESLPPAATPAWALAQECFAPGKSLGEACSQFWGHLVRGLGVILVDSSLPELARVSSFAAQRLVEHLDEAWSFLESRARQLAEQDLPLPLPVQRERVPFFFLENGQRKPLTLNNINDLAEALASHPEAVAPNVWVRPLLQDAALGTSLAILGSSELAYHWQAQDLWALTGVSRPAWKLRPHLTLVGARERRWAHQLGVTPDELLSPRLPRRLVRKPRSEQRFQRLSQRWLEQFRSLAAEGSADLPNLAADLKATEERLAASFAWLAQRMAARAEERMTVERQRFVRLRQSLRPLGRAQERALSVLSPLLTHGLDFPSKLVEALQHLPTDCSRMHLLFWHPGGAW